MSRGEESRSSRRLALVALLLCGSAPAIAGEAPCQGSSRWGANYFPNVTLVTHEGKFVRFFDDLIKDKVVVINFIYTNCPDSCPLETARLLEVQAILGDRVGRDVFMYSITIDPARDTPEVLEQYVKTYQVGPGWTFLTGKEADITLLRRKLGLYIDEIQDGSNDHNLSLIMGNQATGRWRKASPFENPYVLASQIGGWLHNWKLPRKKNDYANAPKLRNISKGESLFRTRCAACHAIGPGDGVVRAGPNLLGVTQRRDQSWLARWLKAPDKMLAEKDPVAMELYGAFNGLPMPNMRLNEREVDLLIDYMDTESRRVARTLQIDAADFAPKTKAPKTCCLKKEGAIVSPNESTIPAAGSGESAEQPNRRGGFSMAAMISIGLGLALGLLTTVFRLRSSMLEKG